MKLQVNNNFLGLELVNGWYLHTLLNFISEVQTSNSLINLAAGVPQGICIPEVQGQGVFHAVMLTKKSSRERNVD